MVVIATTASLPPSRSGTWELRSTNSSFTTVASWNGPRMDCPWKPARETAVRIVTRTNEQRPIIAESSQRGYFRPAGEMAAGCRFSLSRPEQGAAPGRISEAAAAIRAGAQFPAVELDRRRLALV